MQRQYNFIYEKLVENENDIIGHIAYALYKADKIKYIRSFESMHGAGHFNEEDLQHFHEISCIDNNIDR